MAIAAYFSKDVLAINQVLKRGTYEQLVAVLNQHLVEIAFDQAVLTHEGKCALDMVVKIICRLYPYIKIRDLHGSLNQKVEEINVLAKQINKHIEIKQDQPTISLVIGKTALETENPVLYVGSSEWQVLLSQNNPVSSAESALPFAAGIAACIGCANVFRYVFSSLMDHSELDQEVSFSLMEPYNVPSSFKHVTDLGTFNLVGIGAIGNGFLWAISNLPNVKGVCIAVDHEKVDLTNLQRYIELKEIDVKRKAKKTDVAIRILKDRSIQLHPISKKWNDYVADVNDYNHEIVLTALDTGKDRMAVQASLPKQVINAYTGEQILGVSRHLDFVKDACLFCMYLPKETRPSTTEIMARDLKLPEPRIRNLIYLNTKMDTLLLQEIALANRIHYDDLRRFEGMPINQFYKEFICGGVLITVQKWREQNITVEAPVAFQSAMAGVLLATELYLIRSGAIPICNRSHYNPMVVINASQNFNHHSLPKYNDRCFCGDSVYQDTYTNKWKTK